MVNIATTFIQSVTTFYIFYRYTFHQNEMFREMSVGYIQWEIYHLTLTILTIYEAHLVAREVIIIPFYYDDEFQLRINRYPFYIRQGKGTCHVLYDIINCCNDADVTLSVRTILFHSIIDNKQNHNDHPMKCLSMFNVLDILSL